VLQSDVSFFQEFQDIDGQDDTRREIKSFTHYLWRFAGTQSGWLLRAGGGVGLLGYTVLSPLTAVGSAAVTGMARAGFTSVALIASLELEKRLTPAISLGLDFKVPIAFKVSDSPGITAMTARPLENYRLSLGLHWDLGAGFLFDAMVGKELRSLRYTLNGIPGEESSLNATRFGVGLSYAW
jgi:hypothetical protein